MRTCLLFIGDCKATNVAKTATGFLAWRPEQCKGQLRFSREAADLGLPDMSVSEAAEKGINTLVIGVAPIGGALPDSWLDIVVDAAEAGMDILSGLHTRLQRNNRVMEASKCGGGAVIDVREPSGSLPIGSGRKRTGLRLLTVGTDCAVGKMFTSLALERAMKLRGMDVSFRATGQTGIMIAGEGIPIDAVVSDFVAGAAELVSPDNTPGHWDIIEGQGSLYHPAYAGVSLGLLHGSQPDAIVVCHEAGRKTIGDYPDYPVPTVRDCIDLNLKLATLTNPKVRCVGVSVNTSRLSDPDAQVYLAELSSEVGQPCVDAYRYGVEPILDKLTVGF